MVTRSAGRACIEDVPRVSWGGGCGCEFALCLVSAMYTLGAEVPYSLVMGVSGAAFRLTVHRNWWEPGSYSVTAISPDTYAPVRRAIDAIGRDYAIREMGAEADDAAAIMASIEQGVPVLARGVAGPSDYCIVAGYDDGGRTLMGWSTFQDIPDDHDIPHDATGYFRKPGWHANTRGYILLGDAKPAPARRDLYLDSLRWAVGLMRQTAVCGNPAGLGAYNYWADSMLDDSAFPAGDLGELASKYLGVLCILMMVDDRLAGAEFLRTVAGETPELAPELLAAAACCDETGKLRRILGEILPEDFSEAANRRLADAGTRREYAATILRIREQEQMLVEHIERGLAR